MNPDISSSSANHGNFSIQQLEEQDVEGKELIPAIATILMRLLLAMSRTIYIARNRKENTRRVIILEEIRERIVGEQFGMECTRNFWLRN